MSGRVMDLFVAPMLRAFEAPPGSDPAGFFEDLGAEMERFADWQLVEAVKAIKRTRRFRTFPSIAECIDAADGAVNPSPPPQRKPFQAGEEARPLSDYAAAVMCRDEAGRRALAEGWHLGLVDFIKANHRRPQANETGAIIAMSRKVDDLLHEASRPDGHWAVKTAAKAIIARRQYVAGLIDGNSAGVAPEVAA